MKKSLKQVLTTVGIAAIALVTLSACGNTGLDSGKSSDTKVEKKAAKDIKVGVSLSTLSNPFFVSVRNGVENLADKKDTKVQVSDAQNDTAKQNNDVEDLIQKKVDVLIVNPVDSSAITPAVKDANDAGIPVITVDRSSDGGKVLTLVASNSTKGGQMAAKFMIDKLGQDAKIAELQGIPGASATRERGKGFDDATKGKLDIVSKQTAGFDRAKGLSVTENILQGHGDIKGIFSQNDEMALGAVQAAKAAKKSLVIVGFDGEADGIKAVKAGDMAATVAQQPEEMGRLALQAAYDHFDGKTVKKNIESPLQLVTTENAK
ncbi:substrate-binding domain-containing protein [Lacticaseibacillus saniviri]|uniref:ABC-type sugar transport system protein n=1 Tax=Lacticaseibacillus saniviri JCM 17471 = DSM 24301 TaxID=1293598 RepID=A0A0R2MZQ3_9LACO|nr:substrate-binding domain-containing protein [Lacticaseibacillus saniviri]KRO16202.1 ABC-type sugar transport system protein [Lacticaseibacillus saniviri JCM 17471 = DSM 24301]MCG4281656.1 substrate-binding domain-containing protein [Lacticaseibacillus saniviri]